ncbi:Helicase C-terminal, partial [Penicillium chermesinum]
MDDYGALLPFIGISSHTWSQEQETARLDRLKRLVAAACLRRTKQNVENQLMLPHRAEAEQCIELNTSERLLYDFFKAQAFSVAAKSTVGNEAIEKGAHGILSLMNALRLICNHGENLLPPFAIKLWKERDTPPGGDLSVQEATYPRHRAEASLILSSEAFESKLDVSTPDHQGSHSYVPSSKVIALTRTIIAEQEGNNCEALTSVHIVEPQWNPMIQAQAFDRVHRLGQTRDVLITRYIVKDSIET